MVCRAEIFKFLVNQELCSLFNTLLIVLSRKDSAPFEHALNMFHSSASLYLTGRRMPTPQPTRWVAQPPLGAAWGQERLAAGAQLAPRWSGHSGICSGQGMVGTGLGRAEGAWGWAGWSWPPAPGCSFSSDRLLAVVLSQYLLLCSSYL